MIEILYPSSPRLCIFSSTTSSILDFLFCFDVDTSKPVSFFINLIKSVIFGLVRLDPVTLSDVFFESRNPGFSVSGKVIL
jgi:hypothetical protein